MMKVEKQANGLAPQIAGETSGQKGKRTKAHRITEMQSLIKPKMGQSAHDAR
jgi:hypothetical protein